MELRNKVAVVTGGAVRLGRALVQALAAEGVHVCVHFGHSRPAAEELVEQVARLGVRAACVQADLLAPVEAAERVFEFATATFGRVDVLVNNAAIFEPSSVASADSSQWDRHFAINLKAPFFFTQAFVAQLDDRHGHVVNVADWRGTHPARGFTVYALTKAGVVALTRQLALELAPNVQVNAVAPGAILPAKGADAYWQQLPQKIPLRKTGNPNEVCRAVLYLLKSDFVTGQVLHVTGGEELVPA